MDEEQKILGMTRMQIGILAGMVGVLILIVAVGGWFVFRNLSGGGSLAPQPAPSVVPSVTSFVEKIPPTATPTITLTPGPYEQLIPADWKQYKTSLVEIWLPKNFTAASKKTSDFTNNFFASELLMTEVSSKSSAYRMQVAVTYDLLAGDSLDKFLESKFPHIPYQRPQRFPSRHASGPGAERSFPEPEQVAADLALPAPSGRPLRPSRLLRTSTPAPVAAHPQRSARRPCCGVPRVARSRGPRGTGGAQAARHIADPQ